MPQFHLRAEDILLTVVGMKFGKSAIIFAENCPAVFSCKSTLVRNPSVNVWYLLTYLSSRVGYSLIRRGQRGAAQPGINLLDIRNVPVPVLGSNFQSRIEILVKQAKSLGMASDTVFVDAQTFLLFELGLADWHPKHQLTFVKDYSDLEQAERIDAEYFQPKYEEIDKALMKFNGKSIGSCEFLDITTGQYCDNYVASNEGQPYLRGTDLAAGSVEIDNLVYIKEEDQILSKQAQEGDVVVTRVGTIGLSARIPKECAGGTISDNLIRVRILDKKKIDSYYLTCFLGSIIGKSLMLRNARGSVQQRLNQETLKEILLPIPEIEIQARIKQKVTESFNLWNQSKHLLECAKRAVEMAIESDEKTASDWLENETEEMRIS